MHSAKDIQQGESAGHMLFDRHASHILTYVSRQIAHQQDAEDITLEVFTAALHHQELFALSSERQLAWLRRVARNKIIDRYRRNSHVDFIPLEQSLEFTDDALTPEEFTLQREVYKSLYASLTAACQKIEPFSSSFRRREDSRNAGTIPVHPER